MTQSISQSRNLVNATASNSLYFTQNGPIITVPNPTGIFNNLSYFTIECFIYLPNAVASGNTARIVDLGLFSGNQLYFAISSGSTFPLGVFGSNSSQGVLSCGPQWVHVAASYNQRNLFTFVGGVLASTVAKSSINTGTGSTFTIGNNNIGTRGTQAYIQELRVSNVCRYVSQFPPPTYQFIPDENTLVLFHFNEGSGGTVYDSSSNGLVGTLTGSPVPIWSPGNPNLLVNGNNPIFNERSASSGRTLVTGRSAI